MKRLAAAAAMSLVLAGASPSLAATKEAPAATAPAPADPAAQAAALAEAFRLIEVWIEAQRHYLAIPGLSAAVVQGDKTVWAKGFGTSDRSGEVPTTADTIYSICSISKLFTSIALMQQWERGKVRLDGQPSEYLPWSQLAPDQRDSVPLTLRALLSHSAGFPREADFPYWTPPAFAFPSREEIRSRIGRQAPLFPASREFQYSNLGMTLLGETVEAVSGQPYSEYVRREIIDPLGLRDTRPRIPAELYGGQMAVGWGLRGRDGTRPPLELFDPAGITPAAGFSSTANDLAKFAAWHFRLLRSEKAEVLRASTLREMLRVQFISPDWNVTWGLGYMIVRQDPRTLVGHDGDCPGYRSVLLMDPASELAVTVLINAMDSPQAIGATIAALLGQRMQATVFPAAVGQTPPDLSSFAGLYDIQPWAGEQAILPWAGGLAMAATDAANPVERMVRLRYLGNDRFVLVDPQGKERETVTFERGADGSVVALLMNSNRWPRREAI